MHIHAPTQEGAAFEVAARAYIQRYLDRGVPALFVDLRPLFKYVLAVQHDNQA